MSDHKAAQALATATLMDIISQARKMQAAVIREAPPEDHEAIRQDAHTLLDAYLDQMSDAAHHVRAILED